jgi:hypothetical protein
LISQLIFTFPEVRDVARRDFAQGVCWNWRCDPDCLPDDGN